MNYDPASRHYLDWASTAIPFNGETEKEFFANPSSLHAEGRLAKQALENARERCGRVLGVKPETLYFTSGGTESNALVLYSFLVNKGNGRLLYPEIEHPSVIENCRLLGKMGLPLGGIGVEKDGRVTVDTLNKSLEKYGDTRFVSIMGVNNETGALMDIEKLSMALKEFKSRTGKPVHFHCDLVQALGKVPLKLAALDSASFSGHKLGGKRGVGLLYLAKKLQPLYRGGGQEGGIRPGTENCSGAVALAALLEQRANGDTVKVENEKAGERFRYLLGRLAEMSGCALVPEDREVDDKRFSPWILQLRLKGLPGALVARALDKEGIAVSTGSACSSSSKERPVLAAMGLSREAMLEGFRISQGWSTEISDFDALLKSLEKVISLS